MTKEVKKTTPLPQIQVFIGRCWSKKYESMGSALERCILRFDGVQSLEQFGFELLCSLDSELRLSVFFRVSLFHPDVFEGCSRRFLPIHLVLDICGLHTLRWVQ